MPELPIPADFLPLLRNASAICGAAAALLLFSLAVWTWRDVSARSRDLWMRVGALLLVLVLNVFGLIVYMLLRPRDTLSERYEREMIEELLAREISTGRLERRSASPARTSSAPPASGGSASSGSASSGEGGA